MKPGAGRAYEPVRHRMHPYGLGCCSIRVPSGRDRRAAGALSNYHVLSEADWVKAPPSDRSSSAVSAIGRVAMWDLTEVERAVLSARL
jgi:hypothetical protein